MRNSPRAALRRSFHHNTVIETPRPRGTVLKGRTALSAAPGAMREAPQWLSDELGAARDLDQRSQGGKCSSESRLLRTGQYTG